MNNEQERIRFFIFDVESIADASLIAQIRHPGENIEPSEALRLYRNELIEKKGTDFIPYTFQLPISLALMKVRYDYSLNDLIVLKTEDGGPKQICERFWKGWTYYQNPTLVTFNGRGFDVPLLELTAFRYGISIPDWMNYGAKAYDQARNRYNMERHFDINDFLSNNGATHFTGGLNIASKILKKPGKIETQGDMVQDMFDAGSLNEIHQYCRCDVLDTYFVFLRTMLICGKISLEQETELINAAKNWLQEKTSEEPIYQTYLDAWAQQEACPETNFQSPNASN